MLFHFWVRSHVVTAASLSNKLPLIPSHFAHFPDNPKETSLSWEVEVALMERGWQPSTSWPKCLLSAATSHLRHPLSARVKAERAVLRVMQIHNENTAPWTHCSSSWAVSVPSADLFCSYVRWSWCRGRGLLSFYFSQGI